MEDINTTIDYKSLARSDNVSARGYQEYGKLVQTSIIFLLLFILSLTPFQVWDCYTVKQLYAFLLAHSSTFRFNELISWCIVDISKPGMAVIDSGPNDTSTMGTVAGFDESHQTCRVPNFTTVLDSHIKCILVKLKCLVIDTSWPPPTMSYNFTLPHRVLMALASAMDRGVLSTLILRKVALFILLVWDVALQTVTTPQLQTLTVVHQGEMGRKLAGCFILPTPSLSVRLVLIMFSLISLYARLATVHGTNIPGKVNIFNPLTRISRGLLLASESMAVAATPSSVISQLARLQYRYCLCDRPRVV